ncbi:MAG: ABC transporter substrate-binding protein [Acidobacteria bacterium]|nr:ABC transporter substrate-binding protein [Acidobacteriota bacterium]
MMKRLSLVTTVAIGLTALACQARPSRVVFGIGMTASTHAAVQLAAREINAEGGIGGVPLELAGLDFSGIQDEFNPVTVLHLADRFVGDHELLAVIGHSDSASTLSAAAVYNKSGVPQIVTIATNPAITSIGVWTYRLCLSDAAQGPALADYAVSDWHKRRIAVFFVNDDYGRGLDHRFEERARELGAEIVSSVMHRNLLDDDDRKMIHSALVGMKRGTPPDLIVLFQRAAAAVWTVRAIREAGLSVDLIGGDNLAQYSVARLGRELTNGVRVSQFFSLDHSDPRAERFAKAFRQLTGSDPDYGQAFAYDAVFLLRDAVLQGGYSRAGIKAYLDRLIQDRIPVHGVGGTFTFGADHDARRPLYVSEIRNGQFSILKTLAVK